MAVRSSIESVTGQTLRGVDDVCKNECVIKRAGRESGHEVRVQDVAAICGMAGPSRLLDGRGCRGCVRVRLAVRPLLPDPAARSGVLAGRSVLRGLDGTRRPGRG